MKKLIRELIMDCPICGKSHTVQEYEDETKIALAYVDENAFKFNSFKLVDGKLPVNKNEIAIDDMALKKLGYEEKLNQTIEIEYEDYASGEIVI